MGGCGWRAAGTIRGAGGGRCRAASWTWARRCRRRSHASSARSCASRPTSASLVGVYSRADRSALVIVFEATLHGTPRTTTEATEVRAFAPHEIPWDELAFETDAAAVRDLLGDS